MAEKVLDCIVILGDSASSGFGTGGRGYPVLLGEALGAKRIENFSQFGRTTKLMVEEDLPRVAALSPDLVIVQTGMADSLPHPGERVQRILERFAPSTWHGVDGLERRAYFSGSRRRRARQWVVAETKVALKRALIAISGGFTRTSPDEFRIYLDRLFSELERTCPLVVSVGLFDVDQRNFPKQHECSAPFRLVRQQVMAQHTHVIPADIDQHLRRWDDFLPDHAHLNVSGHDVLATEILGALRSTLPDVPMVQPGVA